MSPPESSDSEDEEEQYIQQTHTSTKDTYEIEEMVEDDFLVSEKVHCLNTVFAYKLNILIQQRNMTLPGRLHNLYPCNQTKTHNLWILQQTELSQR